MNRKPTGPLSPHAALLLQHFSREVCLGNHTSGIPQAIAPRLRITEDDVHTAWRELEERALITRERQWTGDWRRITLTFAGKAVLARIPGSDWSVQKPGALTLADLAVIYRQALRHPRWRKPQPDGPLIGPGGHEYLLENAVFLQGVQTYARKHDVTRSGTLNDSGTFALAIDVDTAEQMLQCALFGSPIWKGRSGSTQTAAV